MTQVSRAPAVRPGDAVVRRTAARRQALLHLAAGVALELIVPAEPQVAGHRQEPPRDPLGGGDGIPHVVDRRRVRLRERLHAGGLAVDLHRLHAAGHGLDLGVHIDHVSSPLLRRFGGWVVFGWVVFAGRMLRHPPRVGGEPARPAPARELGAQRVEVRLPEAAERVEPRVGGRERIRVDRVEPTRAVGAHGGEARLAQHAEVLRDRGLRDAELALDDFADLARAALAVGEQLEDAPADRVSEDVERVHGSSIARCAYISQDAIRGIRRMAG